MPKMKKSELLRQCRYFHGEASCPYQNSELESELCWYWDMERVFVEGGGSFVGEGDLYRHLGGKSYPGIPEALLNVMFTSWAKSGYVEKSSLPKFYRLVDDFLAIASDHYPVDKIPK